MGLFEDFGRGLSLLHPVAAPFYVGGAIMIFFVIFGREIKDLLHLGIIFSVVVLFGIIGCIFFYLYFIKKRK